MFGKIFLSILKNNFNGVLIFMSKFKKFSIKLCLSLVFSAAVPLGFGLYNQTSAMESTNANDDQNESLLAAKEAVNNAIKNIEKIDYNDLIEQLNSIDSNKTAELKNNSKNMLPLDNIYILLNLTKKMKKAALKSDKLNEFENNLLNLVNELTSSIKAYANLFIKRNIENKYSAFKNSKNLTHFLKNRLSDTISAFFDQILKICDMDFYSNSQAHYHEYIINKFDENLKRLWQIVEERLEKEVLPGNLYSPTINYDSTEKVKNSNRPSTRIYIKNPENESVFDHLRWTINHICEVYLHQGIEILQKFLKIAKNSRYSAAQNSEHINLAKDLITQFERKRAQLLITRILPDSLTGSASVDNINNLKKFLAEIIANPYIKNMCNDCREINLAIDHLKTALDMIQKEVKDQILDSVAANNDLKQKEIVETNKNYLKEHALSNDTINDILNDSDNNIIIDAQNSQFCDSEYIKNFKNKTKKIAEVADNLKEVCKNILRESNSAETKFSEKLARSDSAEKLFKTAEEIDKATSPSKLKQIKSQINAFTNRIKFSSSDVAKVEELVNLLKIAKLRLYIILDKFVAAKNNNQNLANQLQLLRNTIEKNLQLPESECFANYKHLSSSDVKIDDSYKLKRLTENLNSNSTYSDLLNFSETDNNNEVYGGKDYIETACNNLNDALNIMQKLIIKLAFNSSCHFFEEQNDGTAVKILNQNKTYFENFIEKNYEKFFLNQEINIVQPKVDPYNNDKEAFNLFINATTRFNPENSFIKLIKEKIDSFKK